MAMRSIGSDAPPVAGEPERQWEWHESYRDMMKNMYRTTYTDMTHYREVHCKSDFPGGYGGHIPSLRHDVLFRNTEFDRKYALTNQDPSRDALPSFKDQIQGIPTYTAFPQGARKNPTYGVVRKDGLTTAVAPWGTTVPRRQGLTMRTTPGTIIRTRSSPNLRNSRASPSGGGAYQPDLAEFSSDAGPLPGQTPVMDRLARTVNKANEKASKGRMPTESEILADQVA